MLASSLFFSDACSEEELGQSRAHSVGVVLFELVLEW